MDIYLFSKLWLTFLTPDELKTSLVHSEKILQKFYSITRSMPFQMFRKFCWCKVKRSEPNKTITVETKTVHIWRRLFKSISKKDLCFCVLLLESCYHLNYKIILKPCTLHNIGVSFCTKDFQRSFKITEAVAWHNIIKFLF